MINGLRSIGVVTPNYPSPRFRERGAFVEALVTGWQKDGVAVDVVAPVSWPNRLREFRRSEHGVSIAGNRIISPLYPTFSGRSFGPIELNRLNRWFFMRAAFRGVRNTPNAEIYYGKFLLQGGAAVARIGRKLGRPAFADLGESVLLEAMTASERENASAVVRALDGVICLSERLQAEAIELGAHPNRVLLAPNRADPGKFRPLDRRECREKLSLPQDAFIVVFSGHFIDRKGPLRVLAALENIDKPVFGIFLGRGPQQPFGPRVLHAGPVPNADMPSWLNASDLMMLPTLAEGSCNAVAEALACALPIISSDIPDIRWQVPLEAGILVQPRDIQALSTALGQAMEDPDLLDKKRKWLIKNRSESLLGNRSSTILEWMNIIRKDTNKINR